MTKSFLYAISAICLIGLGTAAAQDTPASDHPSEPASWGRASSGSSLESVLDQPGPIEVETVASATWQVPLSGMLNLKHPKAEAAGLYDGEQPISIYFHALRHPTRGLFIVDTGVEQAFGSERSAVQGVVAKLAKVDSIQVKEPLGAWLERQTQPLAGVLLTHLHIDHIMGMPDVPPGTPIFTGPGEARAGAALNLFTRPVTDRLFSGHAAFAEWQFRPDPSGRFTGVVDVLGDGSLWALHVPGHTPGSTAYLARTPSGPVLLAGDSCHTSWGWDHGVEPGDFSRDVAQSAQSLGQLQELVKRHPRVDVRLGHQPRGQQIL